MFSGLPDLPTHIDWSVFDTLQIPYSALEREHETWITRAAEAAKRTEPPAAVGMAIDVSNADQ
jgi:hypothetical protein